LVLTVGLVAFWIVYAIFGLQASRTKEQETSQQRDDRLRRETVERIEKARRQGAEQVERARRESAARNEEYLQKAKDKFEQARQTKDKNLPGFINAMMEVAFAYRNNQELNKANELFNEAFALYTSPGNKSLIDDSCGQNLWRYLDFLPENEFETKFTKLLRTSETKSPNPSNELDREISTAINDRRYNRSGSQGNQADQKKLWKTALDIRSSVRGENDKSLDPLLRQYASACEASKDIIEAEKSYLKANALTADNSADAVAISDILLAQFYLRQSMFEKADKSWNKAEKATRGGMSKSVAGIFAQLVDNYKKLSRVADVEKMITVLLAHGGDSIVEQLDPQVEDLVSGYIGSGALPKAEALLVKRVNASGTCVEDAAANDWRLKLSDVYLALGREPESNKLFDQVKSITALQGGSVEQILEKRASLLERLGKKDQSTKIRSVLPPPRKNVPIKLTHLLLAQQEIRFGHNTSIDSYNSSDPMQRRGFHRATGITDKSSICCNGPIKTEGNFSFRGTIFGKSGKSTPPNTVSPITSSPPMLRRNSFSNNPEEYIPIPNDTYPLPPALKPPNNASELSAHSTSPFLQSGDYICSQLQGRMMMGTNDSKTIRIFLIDEPKAPTVIESPYNGASQNRPIDYQIWYNGTRKIRLNAASAVVYAPNATVEIPFNATFQGAIVANRIVGEGNNRYSFDTSLSDVVFK
jgi:hypothetical protein